VRKSLRAWLLPIASPLLVSVIALTSTSACSSESEYRRFDSPNGDYRIVVFRRSRLAGMMPGQSGDAPGTVRLFDRKGHVLREAEVEMVQLVETVDWQENSVHIKLVADWPLRE